MATGDEKKGSTPSPFNGELISYAIEKVLKDFGKVHSIHRDYAPNDNETTALALNIGTKTYTIYVTSKDIEGDKPAKAV